MKKFLKFLALTISIYLFFFLGFLMPKEILGMEFLVFMIKGIFVILLYALLELLIDRKIK